MHVVNKLVILGLNPENQHYSVIIDNEGCVPTGEDVEVVFKVYFDVPANWSVIRKQTFVIVDNVVYLIYNVVVPKNLKPKSGKWLDLSKTADLNDADKNVILEGTKI